MSTIRNGQYLVINDGKVVQYLSNDHKEALDYLTRYYRDNRKLKPEAYLVQVQAVLEYPPPEIITMAHERMT
jgi:hypothetical protein